MLNIFSSIKLQIKRKNIFNKSQLMQYIMIDKYFFGLNILKFESGLFQLQLYRFSYFIFIKLYYNQIKILVLDVSVVIFIK